MSTLTSIDRQSELAELSNAPVSDLITTMKSVQSTKKDINK